MLKNKHNGMKDGQKERIPIKLFADFIDKI